jgi:hypothetical protein
VLESVYYCGDSNMRLLDLTAAVETTSSSHNQQQQQYQQKQQPSGTEGIGDQIRGEEEDYITAWSVDAAVDTLLRACGACDRTEDGRSPHTHVAGTVSRGACGGAAASELENGYARVGSVSDSVQRALFSRVVDWYGYGLLSPLALQRALRCPSAVCTAEQSNFRKELRDCIVSGTQAQRVLARKVVVSSATFNVPWLDLIPAETIAQMRLFDAQLPRGTLVQAQEQLELLRGGATDSAVFNILQGALAGAAVIPVNSHLLYWIVYHARQLRSIEAAVRVTYTALAAHGNVSLDRCALRITAFVDAVVLAVRDLCNAMESKSGSEVEAVSCISAYLNQLL